MGKGTESAGQYKSLTGQRCLERSGAGGSIPHRSHHALQSGQPSWAPSIRCAQLFAKLPDAKLRGYTPGTFSFNSGTGRCPTCGGNGFEHVEMQLLADVYLKCSTCDGKRYRDEILELRIEGPLAARPTSPKCCR